MFDKLLTLTKDVITEPVLKSCIIAFVDKYTLKSKAHKVSLTVFMKSLMEVQVKGGKSGKKDEPEEIPMHSKNQYFEIMSEFCFFQN